MKLDEKSLKIGAIALLGAVLIRLCIPFLPQDMHMASLLFFLESGYWAEPSETGQEELPSAQAPEVLPDAVAVFAPQQAEEIRFHNPAGHTFSAEALLLRELNWNLRGDRPKVLILHTHTTESYENKEGYEALPNYRTLDPSYNMLAVGDRLAEKLEQAGIGVIHDRTIHDYPSYNGSYTHARKSIRELLEAFDVPNLAGFLLLAHHLTLRAAEAASCAITFCHCFVLLSFLARRRRFCGTSAASRTERCSWWPRRSANTPAATAW